MNQSIRIFKSDLLETLTHVHPITPLVMWTPFISWLIWRSIQVHQLDTGTVTGLAIAGFLFWTFAEYFLHRFVFHFESDVKAVKYIVWLMHGIHHETPRDKTRLVMPPMPGILLASILYATFRSVLGPIYVEPFFAFFLIGYLCYDYMHFATHHFEPKTAYGIGVKKRHMSHHFINQGLNFGVSSPVWDFVFGTQTNSTSEAAKALRARKFTAPAPVAESLGKGAAETTSTSLLDNTSP